MTATALKRLTKAQFSAMKATPAPCPAKRDDGTPATINVRGFGLYEHLRELVSAINKTGLAAMPTSNMVALRVALLEAHAELVAENFEDFASRLPSNELYVAVFREYAAAPPRPTAPAPAPSPTPVPTPPRPARPAAPAPVPSPTPVPTPPRRTAPAPALPRSAGTPDPLELEPLELDPIDPTPPAPVDPSPAPAEDVPAWFANFDARSREDHLVLHGNGTDSNPGLIAEHRMLVDDYNRRTQKPSFWKMLFGTAPSR